MQSNAVRGLTRQRGSDRPLLKLPRRVSRPTVTPSAISSTLRVPRAFLCYTIRVIVAAPGAGSMPAPTGGGTHPVNPLPAKRIPAQIQSLCRAYTGEAVRSLATIMRRADAPPRARIQAIAMLDRGWGKVAQPHAGADGEGAIEIIIRDLAEERRQGLTSVCRTMLDAPPVSRCGSSGISSPEARTRLTTPPSSEPPRR
jgi:hypothetical protein